MDPIQVIECHVAVLDRNDVDTDQIMPKQFLKRVEKTGYGEFLFYDWFRSGEIELDAHPILVTGRNFGSGSSREHAVWGLVDYGFKAVIAFTAALPPSASPTTSTSGSFSSIAINRLRASGSSSTTSARIRGSVMCGMGDRSWPSRRWVCAVAD